MRPRARFRLALLLAVSAVSAAGCTSHRSTSMPKATPAQFRDLDQIVDQVKTLTSGAGDAHPRGAAIVKSSAAAVFDHTASAADPERNREMYFIRLDGDFKDCTWCS